MKKFLIPFFLFSVVFLISAAPPILRQFGTTNTPTVLTNIIQSLAGGVGQVWTNDVDNGVIYPSGSDPYFTPVAINRTNGGITIGTNTWSVYGFPALSDVLYSVFDPSAGDPSTSLVRQEMQNYSSGGSWGLFESKLTQGTSWPTVEARFQNWNGSDYGMDNTITLDLNATNIVWVIHDTINANLVRFGPLQTSSPYEFYAPRINAGNSMAVFTARGTNVFAVKDHGGITLGSTTNHIVFGATNTEPSSAASPTKWISVRINGESTVYRMPLYQ